MNIQTNKQLLSAIKYIEHIYVYISNTFYNFNNLQNLYDLKTIEFLKYYQIINNILEGLKRLLKSETAMEQGIDQRKTNIDIIPMKHTINKTLYRAQLKDTSQEKLNSEVNGQIICKIMILFGK